MNELERRTDTLGAVVRSLDSVGYYLVRAVTVTGTVVLLLELLLPAVLGPYSSGFPLSYLTGNLDAWRVFRSYAVAAAFYWGFDRAVSKDRRLFATLCAAVAVVSGGNLDISLRTRPLQLLPLVNAPIPFDLELPTTTVLAVGVSLWAFGVFAVSGGTEVNTDANTQRASTEGSLFGWLERRRWLVVSRLTGYTLVAACFVVGGSLVGDLPLVPDVWGQVAPLFPMFGLTVYSFVGTEYLSGIVVLAAGNWATGLAGLQYDGAVPGVAIPAAVLLTLAAAGLWLDRRERRS
jgi:hypothetical protein